MYQNSSILRNALCLLLQSTENDELKNFMDWCEKCFNDAKARSKAQTYNVVVTNAYSSFLNGTYEYAEQKGDQKGYRKYVKFNSRSVNDMQCVLLNRPNSNTQEPKTQNWYFTNTHEPLGQNLRFYCAAENSKANPGNTENCEFLPPQGPKDWFTSNEDVAEISISFVLRDPSSSSQDTEDEDDEDD